MADTIVRLTTVPATPQASIIACESNPAFKGNEQIDLTCGGCSAVLGSNISAKTIATRIVAKFQLLIKCAACGAHNQVSA